jgi:hypothetical protein
MEPFMIISPEHKVVLSILIIKVEGTPTTPIIIPTSTFVSATIMMGAGIDGITTFMIRPTISVSLSTVLMDLDGNQLNSTKWELR